MIFDFKKHNSTNSKKTKSQKRSLTSDQLSVLTQIGQQFEKRNKLIQAKDKNNFEEYRNKSHKNHVCSTMFRNHRELTDMEGSKAMLSLLGSIIIQKVNVQKEELTPKSDGYIDKPPSITETAKVDPIDTRNMNSA